MKLVFVPALLCLAALSLPALGQTGAGTPPLTIPGAQGSSIPLKLVLPSTDQSGMLLVNTKNPRPGLPVSLSFVITNKTNKPVVYNFPTGQKFDITANDAKGALVWTWSKGQTFTQSISRLSIPAGARVVFQAVWNGRTAAGQPAAPGDYTLSARMTSNTGTAITGSIVVNNDPDPMNTGRPTHTPADSGAVRQVDVTPPVTASKTITLGASSSSLPAK